MRTRLFLSGANKKSFKRKNSVGRKCCQLKVLNVLLMHLFVTLLINKTTGSDNRHFLLNTFKNENKEEFLTNSTFCTLEQIEKYILWKRLSQDALSKVKQVWVILQVYSITIGWHKLEPWTNCSKKKLYFGNFSLSTAVVFLLSGWIITWSFICS